MCEAGCLVASQPASDSSQAREAFSEAGKLRNVAGDWELIEHEPVFFPSYAHEWPAEMLHAAGLLTLDLAERSLAEGFGLKDATPHNILFRGARPVFVDVLSFERRQPGDPIWTPYAQFARTFLIPLAAERLSLSSVQEIFLCNRDGMEPESLYARLPGWRRLQPPYLSLASVPKWWGGMAQDSGSLYAKRILSDPEQAEFVLKRLLRGLRRQLNRLQPAASRDSTWADYEATRSHYNDQQRDAKATFVGEVLRQFQPATVLDIGANRGEYSILAAQTGAKVVAIDLDAVVVGEIWKRAERQNLDILPLVVNLSRPSPPLGWRNGECPSFLSRAENRFDAVLMLAVVHHLAVSERIPLEEIVAQAANMCRNLLILEYVDPQDPMFVRLARGRDALYAHLTREYFENCLPPSFEIVRRQPLEGTHRTLYALRRLG